LDHSDQPYFAGLFQDTVTFGAIALPSAGEHDVFLVKLDADSGQVVWAKRAGGEGSDQLRGLAIDADGSALLTGYFEETASFDEHSLSTSGSRGLFLAKIGSPSGNPIFATDPVLAASEGVEYRYVAMVHAWEGDSLGFTAISSPSWLILTDEGNGSATLAGKPSISDLGPHSVEIRVSDGRGGATSQSYQLMVGESNGEPFFTSSPVTTAYLGDFYSYSLSAHDSNGDALSFSLEPGAPDWLALIDDGTGSATLTGTPTEDLAASGEVMDGNVTILVTDGAISVDQTFSLTVSSGWRETRESLGNNWYRLDWFGDFFQTPSDWSYHNELGWVFMNGISPSSVWIWLPSEKSWFWTSKSSYPHLFDHETGDWSYFQYDGSTKKRYLYRYSATNWAEF